MLSIRTAEVLQAWYGIFHSKFVPDRFSDGLLIYTA